jgi:misacylated tRNA(Ala) deacylase
MATELLFRADWYASSTDATVMGISDTGAIITNGTVFYPTGGGQPGDSGLLVRANGAPIALASAVWNDPAKTVVAHVPALGAELTSPAELPNPGERVTLHLDWPLRLLRMRMHTALHVLSVALPYPVTGGSVGDGEGRLDFDIPDMIEKEDVQSRLDALLAMPAAVSDRWITDAELDANPGLVKTMSVQPPRGSGRVRLVEIAGLDLQPCGGTHVSDTSQIGRIEITQIEKKGKLNRRVRVRLA